MCTRVERNTIELASDLVLRHGFEKCHAMLDVLVKASANEFERGRHDYDFPEHNGPFLELVTSVFGVCSPKSAGRSWCRDETIRTLKGDKSLSYRGATCLARLLDICVEEDPNLLSNVFGVLQ